MLAADRLLAILMAVEGGLTILREAGPWQGLQRRIGLVHRAARGTGVWQLQRGYRGQDGLRHGIGGGVGGGGGTPPGFHIRMLSGFEGHHRNRLPSIRIHNVQPLAPLSWAWCWEVGHWWLICMRMQGSVHRIAIGVAVAHLGLGASRSMPFVGPMGVAVAHLGLGTSRGMPFVGPMGEPLRGSVVVRMLVG